MATKKFIAKLALMGVLLSMTQCRQEDSFYANVLRSDVFFQAYDDHKYDFLWVFDNSGSMRPRRDFVKDHMQTFMNILNSRKAIDFQMAVVTTDFFTEGGDLVAAPGGQRVVKSAESSNPVAEMAAIINSITDSPTSFWEQGLESSYQAVFQHKDEFSRPGVPLVVIYLTDEEDWSCKDDCFGVEPENNPDWKPWPTTRYVDYFKNVKKAENTDTYIFPIVGVDSALCDVASLGGRYMSLQQGVGGLSVSGSICNSDLQTSYENVARIIADRGVRFKLSSQASGTGINVFVNQTLVPFSPENYLYFPEDNSILFTGAIPKNGAVVEVTYVQQSN